MKSFLVIGVGTLGRHLCQELCAMRGEVVLADVSAEALEPLLELAASAKVCDCTNIDVLRSFDIPSFDACFVCVETDFQSALEITDQLRELGAKRIYAKADRDLESKFLLRNGADYIIYPEKDAAVRIATNESSDRIFDFFQLSEEFVVCEISPRPDWIGKSVSELGFRAKYNLDLIAAKDGARVRPVRDAGYVFSAKEHVLVMGHMKDISNVT